MATVISHTENFETVHAPGEELRQPLDTITGAQPVRRDGGYYVQRRGKPETRHGVRFSSHEDAERYMEDQQHHIDTYED